MCALRFSRLARSKDDDVRRPFLITVSGQGIDDRFGGNGVEDASSAPIADGLLGFSGSQVARAGAAVFDLAATGRAKAFFHAFVGLDLGHRGTF